MASAYDADKNLFSPELIEIAEFHAQSNLIKDISVLKTQIKLYYKGRHFTSGTRAKKGVFWISCLDETKITDLTVENWKNLEKLVVALMFLLDT
jgi:hypothetical protein